MAAAKKSKALVVSAPLVEVFLGSAKVRLYAGDVMPDGVSDESLEHLKSLGYVEEIDAPAGSDEK